MYCDCHLLVVIDLFRFDCDPLKGCRVRSAINQLVKTPYECSKHLTPKQYENPMLFGSFFLISLLFGTRYQATHYPGLQHCDGSQLGSLIELLKCSALYSPSLTLIWHFNQMGEKTKASFQLLFYILLFCEKYVQKKTWTLSLNYKPHTAHARCLMQKRNIRDAATRKSIWPNTTEWFKWLLEWGHGGFVVKSL